MSNPLPPPTRRDVFSPAAQRRLVDAVNASSLLTGSPFDVQATPGGRTIIDPRVPVITDVGFGTVWDTGPLGTEDDFEDADDNRYWVKVGKLSVNDPDDAGDVATIVDQLAPDGDMTAPEVEGDDLIAQTVIVATDVFHPASRMLAKDDRVMIVGLLSSDGGKAWIILSPGSTLDLYNNGTNHARIDAPAFLNFPETNGTEGIFEFAESTVEDPAGTFRAGADVQFKAGTEDAEGIYWLASANKFVRARAWFTAPPP